MRSYEKEDGIYLKRNLITLTLVSGTLTQTLTSTKCSLSEYVVAPVPGAHLPDTSVQVSSSSSFK